MLQCQFTLQILWELQEQTWNRIRILASETKNLSPDWVLRSATQTLSCILPGKRTQLKSSIWVVQSWEIQGLGCRPSAVSLLQMLHFNSCFSVRMRIFLLGLSKHSIICYHTGRRNEGITTLRRSTFGFFSLAFTRQHIIKQKFQSTLLMPICSPLSSLSESEDMSSRVNICASQSFPLTSAGTVLHTVFFELQYWFCCIYLRAQNGS